MRGQVTDPARRRHAVAVQERDKLGANTRQAGVPGGARPAGARATAQQGAMPGGDRGDRGGIDRSVVHHDHRIQVTRRSQAAVQHRSTVTHWHDHRDVEIGRCWRAARRYRVRHARVSKSAGKQGGRRRLDRPVPQCGERRLASRGQPQHPGGRSAEQRAIAELLGGTVQLDTEAGRQRRRCSRAPAHSASPPSAATTAPVSALLPGPARKASTAAISAGSSSRPAGWVLAKSAAEVRP